MLADGIGDAFRFDFAGAAVNVGLLLVLWRVEVNVVQLRMGDFVNGGLYGAAVRYAPAARSSPRL